MTATRKAGGGESLARCARGVIAAILTLCGSSGVTAGDPVHRLSVGETIGLSLEANPTTGYRWTIDRAVSRGLDRLRVDEAGFTAPPPKDGRPLVGVPGRQNWQVTGLKTGSATLALAYRRPWEQVAPVRRQLYRFAIGK